MRQGFPMNPHTSRKLPQLLCCDAISTGEEKATSSLGGHLCQGQDGVPSPGSLDREASASIPSSSWRPRSLGT